MNCDPIQYRVQLFLASNLSHLDSVRNDPSAENKLLEELQRYIGGHFTIDECRGLLEGCTEFRELLTKSRKLWQEEVRPNIAPPNPLPPIQSPADILLSDSDLRYKDLKFLTDLTRFALDNKELDLKNKTTGQDFSISKEKVITSYLKFFSLRNQFNQIKQKLGGVLEKHAAGEGVALTDAQDSNKQAGEPGGPTAREASQQNIVSSKRNDSPLAADVIESQFSQFTERVNGLMAQHSKTLWLTQFSLVNLRERSKQAERSRSRHRTMTRSLSVDARPN